jgi:hypothetical protein
MKFAEKILGTYIRFSLVRVQPVGYPLNPRLCAAVKVVCIVVCSEYLLRDCVILHQRVVENLQKQTSFIFLSRVKLEGSLMMFII